MKQFKRTVALIAATLICMLPIISQTITAKADEPITYYLKYLESDGGWKYQQLTAWDENDNYGDISYVLAHIKDGDTVVIGSEHSINLDLNVHLANLTVLATDTAIVKANGIDDLYIHGDSVCVINSDVKNAYLYDNCTVNINKNVTNLNILGTNDINVSVGVAGTAEHVKGSDNNKVYYEAYNFASNTLYIEKGSLRTEAKDYSTAPAASAPEASAPAESANAASGNSSSDEYDDVPKTGDNYWVLLLTSTALVCMIASYRLRQN